MGVILSTHILTGAALASLTPAHPLIGFASGVASHFALDAIPHWDYKLYSASINPEKGGKMSFDRDLLRDIRDIGLDVVGGSALALYVFFSPASAWAVVMGMLGGAFPDFLQFIYTRVPQNFLINQIQQFHEWIHSSRKLREEGLSALGIVLQILLVAAIIWFAKS